VPSEMEQVSSILETIDCPLCGEASFDVIKASKYPAGVSANELRAAYYNSSSHKLLDQLVRCRACALSYVNPPVAANLITEGYSDAEDTTFVTQNAERIRSFQRVLRKVLKFLHAKDGTGKRYLDIGCAAGASLVSARSLGFDAVEVELSRWMADFGRRTYGVEIHDGSLQPGRFPPHSFDLIALWDVLEHIPEPNPLLELVGGLLRPDGLFLVSYPDFRSIMGRVLGERWPFWLSVHLLYYDRTTMARQLENCGFRVERYLPYWPTLQLGYALERATPYIPPLKILVGPLRATGLGRLPLTYNVGQTIVIARRTGSAALH
jgi:2-polyprenyl-3-methyl-5-hydroxy-6-metoxy-1,4-benzoquinol methylase